MKSHLEEQLPEFMHSMSPNQFTNRFHGEWCSAVRDKSIIFFLTLLIDNIFLTLLINNIF